MSSFVESLTFHQQTCKACLQCFEVLAGQQKDCCQELQWGSFCVIVMLHQMGQKCKKMALVKVDAKFVNVDFSKSFFKMT